MKKTMATLLALTLAFVLLLTSVGAINVQARGGTFTDVNQDYAFEAIERWADYGIMRGRGGGIFDPYSSTTRAEFATMISNIMGYATEAPVGTFSDIPNNTGMNSSVLRAANAGVFPTGGNFRPTDAITRAEATMAILAMLDIPFQVHDTSPTHFIDDHLFTPSTRGAMRAAYGAGIISGIPANNADGTRSFRFAPNDQISRKHLALLFDNIIAALVHNNTPLRGNVNGFVVVNYGNAVLQNANIIGNVVISEGARGGNISISNVSIDGVLHSQVADLSITLRGDNSTINFDGATNSLTVYGNGITLNNRGEIATLYLYRAAEPSFAWAVREPYRIVIFPDLYGWHVATTGEDYDIDIQNIAGALLFILVEIRCEEVQAGNQWLGSATPVAGQYRMLVNGEPREFVRIVQRGTVQYRLALDLIDEDINYRTVTVEIQVYR